MRLLLLLVKAPASTGDEAAATCESDAEGSAIENLAGLTAHERTRQETGREAHE